jgi:hypothetical protein
VLVAARRTLDLVDPGVHSMHEYDFARECRRRGLPVPARQTVRRDSEGRNRYTDVEFRVGSRALVVEIDGLQHLDMSVAIDDDWRENELRLQGLSLLRFSAIALQLEPDRCFDQITRALHELRRDAGAKAVP